MLALENLIPQGEVHAIKEISRFIFVSRLIFVVAFNSCI